MKLSLTASALASLSLSAGSLFAQTPEYGVELLGPAQVVNDMNEVGAAVGWVLSGPTVQAFLASPGSYQLLPLPAGYQSAWAQGVNDAGVVVGSASTGSLPEFGQAVAWFPDGLGGFTTQLLGALPGHTMSVAYDVNNRGDIVGSSLVPGFQGGPTVWFNSPSGLLDLSSLGAPSSPKQVNDEGVVVGINGDLFDLDTLTPSPLPGLPAGWSGFQGWAINDHGELAGTAIHGGSARSAAIWTVAGGWQSISPAFGLSALVQAFDIGESGVAHAETPTPAAYLPGFGTHSLASLLIPSQQGQWSFPLALGGAVDDFGRIAVIAQDLQTGQSGVALLTPAGCAAPSRYCIAATNSSGAGASLGWAGTPSIVAGSFALLVQSAASSMPGAFYYGSGPLQLPFGDGFRCVGGTSWRLSVQTTDAAGAATRALDLSSAPGIAVGVTRYFQFWFRDPAGPGGSGFNLSDGLEVLVCD